MNFCHLSVPRLVLTSLLLMGNCILLPAQTPSLQETFIRGNIDYGNGDFAAAEAAYRTVLESAQSSELHYNLGNALARQDKWSEAAFHYMRAYAMDPSAEAAQANLLLAAERLHLSSQYPKLASPADMMPERLWVILAAAAFWIAIIIFFQRDLLSWELPLRKTLALLAFLVFVTAGVATFQHNLFDQWTVVSNPMVSLRVAPAEQSPGESVLVQGDPIRLLGLQNGFFHAMNASGEEGFVMPDEIYRLSKD